jgi:thymidylate kinase
VGIDGSGKTTLCQKLLSELQKNSSDIQYVHSYHEPFLLKPLRSFAKATLMRDTDEFVNYTHYRNRKTLVSNKHKMLSRIYTIVWILDYMLQTLFQVSVPKLMGACLIVDRYIYDAVLNASLTANLSRHTSYQIIDMMLKIFPKPDFVFMIDLPEEIAFTRKNDIQSVEYLRERRYIYIEMAARYGFVKLDGQAEPDAILTQARLALSC